MIISPHVIKENIMISLSFVVGFVLTILPLPSWAIWYRPDWVLLILVFWLLMIPHRLGIASAWLVGFLMDLLTGTEIGLHALFFTLLAYLILKFNLVLRGMSSGQRFLLVCVIEAVYLAVYYWATTYNNAYSQMWLYWMPIMTTALCWPWVLMLLRDYQQRFEIK